MPKKIDKAANISADLVVALKGHPLFESLEATLIDEIVACMVEYKHEAGAEVIKEGDPGDSYVVAEGKLEAFMAASGDEAISEYGPKEAFGELALLYNSPRAATVKCVSASVVYGLERLAFRKLVMSHNSLAKKGVEELLEKVPIFQKAVSAILRNFLRNSGAILRNYSDAAPFLSRGSSPSSATGQNASETNARFLIQMGDAADSLYGRVGRACATVEREEELMRISTSSAAHLGEACLEGADAMYVITSSRSPSTPLAPTARPPRTSRA